MSSVCVLALALQISVPREVIALDLELNRQEFELLQEILESRLANLRQEIYHTETPAYTDELKANKKMLEELIQKLKDTALISAIRKTG